MIEKLLGEPYFKEDLWERILLLPKNKNRKNTSTGYGDLLSEISSSLIRHYSKDEAIPAFFNEAIKDSFFASAPIVEKEILSVLFFYYLQEKSGPEYFRLAQEFDSGSLQKKCSMIGVESYLIDRNVEILLIRARS